jgi:hypothetical protein
MTQAPLGWLSIIRVGLVQSALGGVVALTTSTLNRVMVVEFALPAMLPAALVAWHYAIQLSRPRWGYGSDMGHRRTPWIIGGMGVLALGGLLATNATVLMESSPVIGILLGILAFTMSDVDRMGIGGVMAAAVSHLTAAGVRPRPLHLSFDIDACDPALAPATLREALDVQAQVATNLVAPMLLVRALLPCLMRLPSAGIVGIGAMAFFAYAYLLSVDYGFSRATLAALVMAVLAGMCLGFLPHNVFPARIFMGDTGSMLIGLLLASGVITLTGQVDPSALPTATIIPTLLPILLPIAGVAVTLLDLLLAVVRRTRARRSPFAPDKSHLHHRLLEMGHSQRRAVWLMYGWAAVVAGTAVSMAFVPVTLALSGFAIGIFLLVIAVISPQWSGVNEEQATESSQDDPAAQPQSATAKSSGIA